MRKLPPLRSLITFNEVAKTNSVTQASKNLFVTQSAVSQQIKILENYIGFSLFERKNNKIILNKIGQKFAKRVDTWINHLIEEVSLLKSNYGEDNNNKITLSFGATWATRWFIPKISDLTNKFPEINLNLSMTEYDENNKNINNNNKISKTLKADLSLVTKKPFEAEGLITELFYKENIILACSPNYYKSNFENEPCERWLKNLLNAQLLQTEEQKITKEWCSWLNKMFEKYSKIEDQSLWHNLRSSCSSNSNILYDKFSKLNFANLDQAIIAAIGGTGVVLTDSSLILNELESGALLPVFKNGQFPGKSLYFLYDEFSPNKHSIENIISWSLEQIEKNIKVVNKFYAQ